ncbi:hypothetical protein ACHAXN_005276 [Cyclotella atomus]
MATESHYFSHIIVLLVLLAPTILCSSYTNPKPIDPIYWPDKFPAKNHCSKCGLCETSYVTHVKDACAFLGDGMKRNIDGLESSVHGRRRKIEDTHIVADETRFGVMHTPMFLARGKRIPNAQWTGCVTGIAISMIQSGMVDAVICIASEDDGSDEGWSTPKPILARTADDVLRGRGVKPALAPSLNVLDELRDSPDIKKLLFCGVGCAVQAFRAIENELKLEEVYILGTNCADNSPTPEAARNFLQRSVPDLVDGKKIQGYEFMQDFRVHVKYDSDTLPTPNYEKMPYFCLPGDVAQFAIADSCLACFDYTNALADVVVGYMAAPIDTSSFQMHASQQTITVRNSRGERMIRNAVDAGRLEIGPDATGNGRHEQFASATVASDNIVQSMIGGTAQDKGMSRFLGELMATVLTSIGPKGVNFARYSIDYHVMRNYLHIVDVWGEADAHKMLPEYANSIVQHYVNTDKGFCQIVEKIRAKK